MVLGAVAVGLLSILATGCARSAPVNVPTVVLVEDVSDASSAPSAPSPPADEADVWRAREEVEVEWHGAWWPAVVLEKRGPRFLVHYEGYGDDWDEVVGPERIRERRAAVHVDESDEDRDEPDP